MAFAGINHWAVLVAALAAWVLGAVWYRAFSKPWMAALGKTEADIRAPDGKRGPVGPLILAFIAALIMAWMLAGILGHLGAVTVKNGVITGAFCWFGFVITTMAVNNAFAQRRPILLVIDGGYWLAALILMGAIIGVFGVK